MKGKRQGNSSCGKACYVTSSLRFMWWFAGRLIIVSNHLPLRVKRATTSWEFEWDEDALVGQAKASELAAERE